MNGMETNNNIINSNTKRHSLLMSSNRSSLRQSQQRYSLLPSQTNNMRSSIAVRAYGNTAGPTSTTSTSTSNNNYNNNNHSINSSSRRDLRPLGDKNFQNLIAQDILDYLNKEQFSIETNYPVSLKTFKQPTQKDFVTVFKWCYHRLDPGFSFVKTWETDLYTILKTIKYPYLNSITKSQISAVGGSNWPKFLGMLHWLVQIMKSLDMNLIGIDQNICDQNTQDMTILTNHNSTTLLGKEDQELKMIKYESMAEKVFIEFIIESYKNFLQMNDDMSKIIPKLEKNFDKFTKIIETDTLIIDELNTNLKIKFSSIMENFVKLNDLKTNNLILQKDYNKVDNFVKLMQNKKNEWTVKLEKIDQEIELKHVNIANLKEKIGQYEKELDQKGFSIEDIQKKMELQTEISKNLKSIESNLEMMQNSQKSTNLEYKKLSNSLENSIMKYNFTLESLNGTGNGLSNILPTEVSFQQLQLSMDTISMEKIQSINKLLNSWNNEINGNIVTLQQKNLQIESQIESLQTEIENKNVYITDLENQYLMTKNENEITMQEFETQILEKQCDIEKLENKITELNQQVNDYLHDAQREIKSKEQEYKELSSNCEKNEKEIVYKVKEIVKYVKEFQNAFKQGLNEITPSPSETSIL